MIIEREDQAPFIEPEMSYDGMISVYDEGSSTPRRVPGAILRLWAKLREEVGIIQARQKPGMKFKTRAADELIGKIRGPVNDLGIIIYPSSSAGSRGFPVDDGTLASVKLDIIVQAIEDGSRIKLSGFGLGADSQDKAGGKAGTYAFKQALLQGLLANGLDDTDDSDTPIRGGVRRSQPKASSGSVTKPPPADPNVVREAFERASTQVEFDNAKALLSTLDKSSIEAIKPIALAAKIRITT